MTRSLINAVGQVLVSEADWTRTVRETAAILGYIHQYHTRDSRGADWGFPDWVFIRTDARGPRTAFVELKSTTGQPTAEQQDYIEALLESGEWAACFWPSQFDELVEWLK